MKKELQNLIAQGSTDKALQKLLEITEEQGYPDLHQELILQSARYEQYASEKRLGTASKEDSSISIANINQALLQIIGQLPDELSATTTASKKRPVQEQSTAGNWWRWVVGAGVVIGIFAGIAEVSGFSLKDLFFTPSSGSNTVTVLVHGEDGKDQLVLPGRGMVRMVYGDAIISEQINNEGEATFKQVPERFFQADARVEIFFQDPQGEPYRAVYHDSAYQLKKGEHIGLPVRLIGLGQIRGIVKDFETGDPIEGVRISVLGEEAFSDQYGEYTLEIPPEKQRQFQTVRAFKDGYQSWELNRVPVQTQREIPVLMKPK